MASKLNISIAMATYNGERFLCEQLESLARQTLPPYELVVRDDGSSDRTVEILTAFAREATFPVRVYRNEARLGPGDNFLKAASLCKGDLIAFCDQDDIWLREKLARCAEAFEDDDVILTLHSGEIVDENLRAVGRRCPQIDHDSVASPLTVGPARNDRHGFAMVYRSSLPLVLDKGAMSARAGHSGAMDHDGWVYFLGSIFGKTAYIGQPLVLYRQHSANMSRYAFTFSDRSRAYLSTGTTNYVKTAQMMVRVAAYLDQASELLPERQRLSAKKGADHYRYAAKLLHERANIYRKEEPVWIRFRSLIRLLAKREYSHQSTIGWDFLSLARDASIGILGMDRLVRKRLA